MVKHAHAKKIELNHQWKNSNSISPPKASVMVALQNKTGKSHVNFLFKAQLGVHSTLSSELTQAFLNSFACPASKDQRQTCYA